MSRPSRRQVFSLPPQPIQPDLYSSVPQASPPRASYQGPRSAQGHGSQQGHYYIYQVAGPRPIPTRSYSRDGENSQVQFDNRPPPSHSHSISREGQHYQGYVNSIRPEPRHTHSMPTEGETYQGYISSSLPPPYHSQPAHQRPPSRDRESSQDHAGNDQTSIITSSHNVSTRQTHRRTSGRNAVAQGVASGQIGGAYGPYAYNVQQGTNVGVYGGSRFAAKPPSESSSSTPEYAGSPTTPVAPPPPPPPRTMTVPQHEWDKDPDIDDTLHSPDPHHHMESWSPTSWRGWVNVGALLAIGAALFTLFIGYPVISFSRLNNRIIKGYNLGHINGSGQIPVFPGMPQLIDLDTPKEAYNRTGNDGHKYNLVFSDEFNRDGRSFYPGDDPYWEAVDMHYWATGNYEWYDPSAVTTKNGSLVITMTEEYQHELNFMSGMLQSWNKLCFTTGYIEVAISLPLSSRQVGLWPGAWTLGNLGRAGYGASTEGIWPYTYDTCDTGTFPMQQARDGSPGTDVLTYQGTRLSVLPGQKLSACSCPGSDHPGPRHNVGRGAPEIDIIEAEIDQTRYVGIASQSFQVAPFNHNYDTVRTEPATRIYNSNVTKFNNYQGGSYQQAVSALSDIDPRYYGGREFTTYAYEMWSNPNARDEGFITWYNQGVPSWTATSATVGPDPIVNISQRLISEEPMYVILNLGMAFNFQQPDFKHLTFPAKMYVDYVRIFQREGVKDGLTCDPPNRPTAKYIRDHIAAYMNRDLTQWSSANFTFPRNSLYDGC